MLQKIISLISVHKKYYTLLYYNLLYNTILARACLKNAFRQMCVTVCGRFVPNEGGVGGKGIKCNALRRLNVVQISRKVGRIDGGNDF